MDIGVSTACLYPLETEKALYELAERGVKNVEIFVNSIDELEGQVLVELRKNHRRIRDERNIHASVFFAYGNAVSFR